MTEFTGEVLLLLMLTKHPKYQEVHYLQKTMDVDCEGRHRTCSHSLSNILKSKTLCRAPPKTKPLQ